MIKEAMRERVAEKVLSHETDITLEEIRKAEDRLRDGYYKRCEDDLMATVKEILSIRLNDKGEPDPEGRYAVKVVDLKASVPPFTPYKIFVETSGNRPKDIVYHMGQLQRQETLIEAGFARIVEE